MSKYIHDLSILNSITKYPSILTYHTIGERGVLKDEVQISFNGEDVLGTEKVDGTNARMIFVPKNNIFPVSQTFLIGSREELLYGKGDLVINPAQNIVPELVDIAHRIESQIYPNDLVVVYGEVYGGNIGSGSKNYTKDKDERSFRVFDIACMTLEEVKPLALMLPADISLWREKQQGQKFLKADTVKVACGAMKLETVPNLILIGDLPTKVQDTYEWMRRHLTRTLCALDNTAAFNPEGMVIRTADRKKIAKIRYEDYERTLRKK